LFLCFHLELATIGSTYNIFNGLLLHYNICNVGFSWWHVNETVFFISSLIIISLCVWYVTVVVRTIMLAGGTRVCSSPRPANSTCNLSPLPKIKTENHTLWIQVINTYSPFLCSISLQWLSPSSDSGLVVNISF